MPASADVGVRLRHIVCIVLGMAVRGVEWDLFGRKRMRVSRVRLAIESIVVRLITWPLTLPGPILLPNLLHFLPLLPLFLQMLTSHMILYMQLD